jgi:hypothetical protein
MKTTVIHIKNAPKNWRSNPDYVYIGRAGKGLSGYFGNPHKVGRCLVCNVEHAQGEACAAFGIYFKQKIVEDVQFHEAVLRLRGKFLVCFCKTGQGQAGSDTPCHGDIYVSFLEENT